MKKTMIVLSVILTISGCISIKAPENLVSDTVNVGKDIYHAVKDKLSNDPQVDSTRLFSYTYPVPDDEEIGVSTSRCIASALVTVRKALNVYNVEIEKSSTEMTQENGKPVLQCTILVAKGA